MSYNSNPPQYPYHGNSNRNAPIPRPAQDVRYVNSQNPSQSPYPYPQQGNSLRQQQMMPSQLPQQMPNHMSQQMSGHMSASMSQQQIASQKPIQQQHQQQMAPQKPVQSAMQIPSQNQSSQQQMSQQMMSQKPIAPPQSSLSAPYSRATISELVLVPTELSSFAADPQFQQTLLKVKEQTLINFISLNRITENSVESVAIDAPTKESAQLARNLIETHFKLQQKLMTAESRLKKVETEFFSAQGEIASGMMVEFSIPSDLIGLIIGKKGARIKQIEQDTGVNSINVNGETGRITVNGPDSTSVQRAREMLELHEESLELSQLQTDWLNNKNNLGTLADIKSVSNLMLTRINSANNTLDVVGVIAAVRSAKLMLATQLEYIDKQIEIESSEKNIREQLSAVRKQYGIGHNQYSNKQQGGDRGDRGNYSNNNSNNGQYVKQSSSQQQSGSYNDRNERNDRYQNQHESQRDNRGDGGNRQQSRQQNASAGSSRTAVASDSLQTLPVPPAKNSSQKSTPPVKGVATSSRGQGADIDSIIGHTTVGVAANKPTAAGLATLMSHEQFMSAAVGGSIAVTTGSSGRQVQVVKAVLPESGANRDISNTNNPNNPQYRNNKQQGGNNAGNNRNNNQNQKVPVHNHQNQKSSSAAASDTPPPIPIVTLSGGLLITAPSATVSTDNAKTTTNNNRNKNNNQNNRNKNNADTTIASSVVAPGETSSAQTAAKHSNQQPAKQNQPKSRTVTDVQQPAQPMLLQLLQDQKKVAPSISAADGGEVKKNTRNQNNKNNNKSVVSASGVVPAEVRLKDLLSHVSVVSVTNGGELTGALANLKLNDAAISGPPPKNNNNRNNNRNNNNQNRTKAVPVSSEGGDSSSSSAPVVVPVSSTSAVSAAVVADTLPKRAKRNPGSSAVVADSSSGLSLGGKSAPAFSSSAATVTPPPGIVASSSAVPAAAV